MAREPGVGLDRDRIAAQRLLAGLDEIGEAVAVALGRQIALELGDEQAAVGQDQDSERTGGLDEACRRNRLARRGRMAEAVAANGARILADEALDLFLRVVVDDLVLFLRLLGLELGVPVPVAVLLLVGVALVRCDQLGQHPCQRVDLMLAQLGARGGRGLLRGEDALEPEQEAETDFPAGRGGGATGVDLRQRLVERGAAGGAGRQHLVRLFAGVKDGLARPVLRAERVGLQAIRRVRRVCRLKYRF